MEKVMQIIESSVLQVAVDEKGAQLVNLVSKNNQSDYFKDGDTQNRLKIVFAENGQDEKNLAELLPWTVVDKGDARVSLTLIDNSASYKKFPYHFEVIVSYVLEENRINIKCYLKNNSHKEMPFSLKFLLPISEEWDIKENINEFELSKMDIKVKFASTNLTLVLRDKNFIATTNDEILNGNQSTEFTMTLTAN
ncbi:MULTISPECIES: aldose epimerase [unclassified Lactobacillus]|uniref:aldose epimerase family protein n=1 Tax=unclassified Lactobacillus TaxID=2620435 RepID=UPI000EFA7431|nr:MULTISPECIES: aldose epimerase [unclassified Lactobacillus]RMC23686.1 aldose epimerase [Lactobacillus sp. ESL0247]RMC27446.1 aldose epimerase [Lactobacillus sp. ESL0246]RMC30647.1 aldose epimerase [Lactobacillus sp. ESL0245]